MQCLDEQAAQTLTWGQLDPATRSEFEAHLEGCPACRQLLSRTHRSLSSNPSDVDLTPTAVGKPRSDSADAPAPAEPPVRGTAVGRYLLLERVGAGGMGVVYLAYDPDLDRRIAVKLIRDVGGGEQDVERQQRFLREAKAMARPQHPEVIAVYDVGTALQGVFIAMEYVDGTTLRGWLSARPRSWREVLAMFLRVGHGLAAAHAAGLVHRDFKPDNVLVGRDDRVRVTDFGLARLLEGEPAELPRTPDASPSDRITRSGQFIGSPAYSAPEQMDGQPADPRADIFSYCVALYEALYGERPFKGRTALELYQAIKTENVSPPPKGTRVPAWLRRVVLQGLRAKPADRCPSMKELLAALGKDPSVGRRRLFGAAAALGIGAAVFLLAGRELSQRKQLCHGGDAELAAIWNPQTQQSGRRAFLATRQPFAEQVWNSAREQLTNYGRAWAQMHVEACEATRLRGEQSDEVLDLRMVCLSQRLQEIQASAALFEHADPMVVQHAVALASGLSPLSECADVEALKEPIRPPRDPDARAKVAAVREQIAAAKALMAAGRYAEGSEIAKGAVESANSLAYEPVKAEALFQFGELEMRQRQDAAADATLKDAFVSAERSRADALAARVATVLLNATNMDRGHPAEAHLWARVAEALGQRIPENPTLNAYLHRSLGDLLESESHYAEAIPELRKALAMSEAAVGPETIDAATSHNDLGLALWHKGDNAAAAGEISKALAIEEKLLGPDHPLIAQGHNNLGGVLRESDDKTALVQLRLALAGYEKSLGPDHLSTGECRENIGLLLAQQGKLPEALVELRRALEIEQKTLAPDSPGIAHNLDNTAEVLWRLGNYDEALSSLKRALAIQERVVGPESEEAGRAHMTIGAVLSGQGKLKEALVEMHRGLAIFEKTVGPDSAAAADAHSNLGDVLNTAGRLDEALQEMQLALAIQQKVAGLRPASLALTIGNMGEVDLKRHNYAAAISQLERALAALQLAAPDPSTLGEFRFALAQARWGSRQKPEAVVQAQAALAEYAKIPERKKESEEVKAWLSTHAAD